MNIFVLIGFGILNVGIAADIFSLALITVDSIETLDSFTRSFPKGLD
jgi:hypothetical protein